jgi:O-antigen/teichoic acid export membrane protein
MILFVRPLKAPDDTGLAVYASLFCLLATLDLYSAAVLQGMGNLRLLNVLRLVQPTVYIVLLIAIVFVDTLTTYLTLISVLIASCISVCVGMSLMPPPKPGWDAGCAVAILRVSQSVHLSNTLFYISNELDKVLAVTYGSPTSAGLYVVAQSLAATFVSVVLPAANVYLVPRIAAADDRKKQFEILRLATTIAAIGALAFLLVMGTASPFLVEALFGAKFVPALEVLYILLIGNGAKGLRLVLDRCLRGCGFFGLTIWGELIVMGAQMLGILMWPGAVTTYNVAVMFGLSQGLGLAAMIAAFKARASTIGISGAVVDIRGAWNLVRTSGKMGPSRNDAP